MISIKKQCGAWASQRPRCFLNRGFCKCWGNSEEVPRLHHLHLDIVDVGFATEMVIARAFVPIDPKDLFVPQLSNHWCDLVPVSFAQGSDGDGVGVMQLDLAPAVADSLAQAVTDFPAPSAPLEVPCGVVRGHGSQVVMPNSAQAFCRGPGSDGGSSAATIAPTLVAESEPCSIVDRFPTMGPAPVLGSVSATVQRSEVVARSEVQTSFATPLGPSAVWASPDTLVLRGLLHFVPDDTLWRMPCWLPVKVSDSLLEGMKPPGIRSAACITNLLLGFDPATMTYHKESQVYDPTQNITASMVTKAQSVQKGLQLLTTTKVTPTVLQAQGVHIAKQWIQHTINREIVYGPMVAYFASDHQFENRFDAPNSDFSFPTHGVLPGPGKTKLQAGPVFGGHR
jgi:hypothetical protein